MDDLIKKIIIAASQAPSGDNCQPWKFEIVGNSQINLYILPQRDKSLYSWGNRASLLALGACIENMVVAGKHFGFSVTVNLFPDRTCPDLVAKLTLAKSSNEDSELYEAIFERCTNRKHYKKHSLLIEQTNYLLNLKKKVDSAGVLLTNNRGNIETLAKLASLNEKILFENQDMHSFFYSHINWTNRDDEQKKTGFYVKTLEIPRYALPSFKLARNWIILKWLNKFGFSKIIAKENSKTYKASAAIGAITIPDNSPHSYIMAGRLLEKIWLRATKEKLSFQPLTGICFLMQKVASHSTKELSAHHIKLITESYHKIQAIFSAKNKTIALMFRVGQSEKASGRTSRLSIESIIT